MSFKEYLLFQKTITENFNLPCCFNLFKSKFFLKFVSFINCLLVS